TGNPLENSVQSMSLICDTMSTPTTTRAAPATSSGTTWVSGVKNTASKKSTPVTTEARPVRAPSPTPAAESMKIVLDDEDVAPPATAPIPSTMSADFSLGKLPSASASPASLVSPVRVPTASKKLVNNSVKTSMM